MNLYAVNLDVKLMVILFFPLNMVLFWMFNPIFLESGYDLSWEIG